MNVAPVDKYEFVSLADCKKEELPNVKKIFSHVCDSFYGQQPEIVRDVEDRRERKTEILKVDGKAVACLIYKRALATTFEQEGLMDCMEVSFMSLYHPKGDREKGYQKLLIDRIEYIAKEMSAKSIAYVIPESLQERWLELDGCGFEKKYIQKTDKLLECMFMKTFQKRLKREVPEQAPKTYTLPLKQPYISQVQSGKKTIEGRINSGGPANYKVGDTISFVNNQITCNCVITRIEKFVGFREMLAAVDFAKCIPGAKSVDDAFRAYEAINGYLDRAKRSGVLAIYIERK